MKKTPFGNDLLIQQFLDQLLLEQGFSKESPEVLQELREDLEKRMNYHLDMAVASAIPEDKIDEFNAVLESESEEKIKEFITQHVPDLQSVMTKALESFRDIYLGA
jgi:hypothetical protein